MNTSTPLSTAGQTSQRQIGIMLKIVIGYVAILAILVVVASILMINLQNFVGQFKTVTEHDFLIVQHAKELEKLVLDLETGERGYIITGNEAFLEPYNAALDRFDTIAQELTVLISDDDVDDITLLNEAIALKEQWVEEVGNPYIEMRRRFGATQLNENNWDRYNEIITAVQSQTGKSIIDSYRDTMQTFLENELTITAQNVADSEATINTLQIVLVVLTLGAIVLGLGIGIYLGRNIAGNIREVMNAALRVAGGDISARATVQSNDEVGVLANAFNMMAESLERTMASQVAKEYLEGIINNYRDFIARVTEGDLTTRLELGNGTLQQSDDNKDLYELGVNLNMMVESLNNITRQVRESVSGITSAAAEIQAATTQQIASTTEQDSAVTQTVATVEEVRTTVQQTSERAQAVADAAQESVEVSRQGEEAVDDTIEGMTLIRQRVENIAETILSLSERTQQIGEIINTVNALADQSKLLALNASIEAARAGEEGRGFAVVAAEVRQLAEQSRQATSRIGEILSEIQQATNTAVMVTEEGSKGAERGVELVNRAGKAIRDLAATLEDATQAAVQIAASTHQQTNGMDQLGSAMRQIKQASAQAAASSRQTEQSARDLTETSRLLEQAVARYKLEA